ncbi:MAG: methyltransferase type 12 [Chlorobi bacterium]|nr:methyltransferase type 12 [Chlorobiota bacterium]
MNGTPEMDSNEGRPMIADGDIPACRVCGNVQGNAVHVAREMMFGLRDEFRYVECAGCGLLQIAGIPKDLGRYYADGYYSYGQDGEGGWLRNFMKRRRFAHASGSFDPIGWALTRKYGVPAMADWARRARIGRNDAVLDVGCGSGLLLRQMRDAGFTNLTGVDPYIEADIAYDDGVRVYRRAIEDLEGRFDAVMFHHSFEHMADPLAMLRHASRLLAPGRFALIRIPVMGYAWRTYGVDWVQVDAPRHLFIHSVRSMEMLARDAGFTITDIVYDSGAFQFIGSEQYRRDIPFTDSRSWFINPDQSIFSPAEIAAFAAKADELNRAGDGDAAGFYLRKN